jgi:3-hydroxyisobutyrate dehydrogenase
MRSLFIRFNFSSTPVGFIGIGKMGQGMIQNLARTKRVLAYDANPNFMRNLSNTTNITQMDSLKSMT